MKWNDQKKYKLAIIISGFVCSSLFYFIVALVPNNSESLGIENVSQHSTKKIGLKQVDVWREI